jgi:hypothetical protein
MSKIILNRHNLEKLVVQGLDLKAGKMHAQFKMQFLLKL